MQLSLGEDTLSSNYSLLSLFSPFFMNSFAKKIIKSSYIVLFFLLFFQNSFAQNVPIDNKNDNNPPKLFINCPPNTNCYQDYIRTELSFFDFVRDRFLSDIQLLIAVQDNGGGGQGYTISFIGQKKFEGMGDTLKFATKQADTDDMIRSQFVKTLKQGLAPFVMKTELSKQMIVDFPKRKSELAVIQNDKWDYWVFNVNANGYFQGESNQKFYNLNGNININRTTAENRFAASAFYSQNTRQFVIDDEEIIVKRKGYGGGLIFVKSMNEHLSLGGVYSGRHSVFTNLKFQQIMAPAIEYNLFPTSQNTRKQFRWIYRMGVQGTHFIETTIYDRDYEMFAFHQVNGILSITQPWGTVAASVRGSQFLSDKTKYRLGVDLDMNWRIVEGLSLGIYGSLSYIKDQISLAKSSVDPNLLLLNGRQLPTSFSYETQINISYTFGSINNSVVNPRMQGID